MKIKKIKNIMFSFIAPMMLVSCGENTGVSSQMKFYLRPTFSGGYVEHINKSKDDETEVSYMTITALLTADDASMDVLPSDFTVVDKGKTYSGVCFVKSMNRSSIIVNGVVESVSYIVDTQTDKLTINKDYKDNLSIEFDTVLSDDAALSLKKTKITEKLG